MSAPTAKFRVDKPFNAHGKEYEVGQLIAHDELTTWSPGTLETRVEKGYLFLVADVAEEGKAVVTAKEKAKAILDSAKSEATEIVATANKIAEETIAAAEAKAAAIVAAAAPAPTE